MDYVLQICIDFIHLLAEFSVHLHFLSEIITKKNKVIANQPCMRGALLIHGR